MKNKSLRLNAGSQKSEKVLAGITLSRKDKKFYGWFLLVACLVTLLYWYMGGKNPFIIPTLLCIALVYRNHRKRSQRPAR